MNARTWIPAATLLALTASVTAGWMWTREAPPAPQGQEAVPAPKNKQGLRHAAPVQVRLVDQTPLLTARSLLPLATTPEEKQLALQAERLGNHSVDLAFSDALRRAATTPVPKTPELKELVEAKAKALSAVEAGEQLVARLAKQLAVAPESKKDVLEDQIDITKAQLELDKDELETASNDLAQAGGDPQAKIRRLKEAHEAADRESSQAMVAAKPPSAFQPGSFIGRLLEWRLQRDKCARLEKAQAEAQTKEQALVKRRAEIEAQANKEKDEREAARSAASTLMKGASRGLDRDEAKAAVSSLKQFGDVQRRLASMARRIQDQRGLAETYGTWLGLADGFRNAALHKLLTQGLEMLGVVLAAYLLGLLIDWMLHHSKSSKERTSAGASKSVLKVIIRVIAVLAIGFLIVGIPAQATTIFGLAGAGLTVALKDFIVAFFGWFILMGKNGIRLGDWVEIRGVGGEVVEIGLLRTVILETGSWADAGHPTGRRVAFVNNFAIEGHFFNFSTSGKWMWDELNVVIPAGQDPYATIDGVQKLVEQQTEANAKIAEAEWQQTAARYKVKAFSAVPGVQVIPGANGMEIRARYLTRAFERHETRLRMNQAVVELMHGPRAGS
ncbi:mechanosensitive ion channel family protein [Geothrix sp. PMB-07]|uniref:mechanosensitive ion channel family protein n=1 Tax=Geothrix sp. PMB-07 TaxID=3068640 RepID=UPI002741402B|nr:mechanosensitive ion channel domain-containing protein [Geothrix sp. PMB-07]WLT33187.1 mechanosensitive ion channel [Geothrix sp. PMB-07]